MLEWFICPDKKQVKVTDCLAQCRMGSRCLTLPTLHILGAEREWHGEPSTTQLLNGTMMEYLKLTMPYAVDPKSRAFLLAGTKHHEQLEEVANKLGIPAEIALSTDRDIFDLLEEEDGELTLTDYKNWGSFKLAKALGMKEIGKKPHPTEVYKSNGKWGKAGEAKMIPVFDSIEEEADNWEAELQLNNYRVKLKEEWGIDIAKMRLQVTVRDGGIHSAFAKGIMENIYLVPVKFIEDEVVKGYFLTKREQLLEALEHGWTNPCLPRERWDDRRCKGYCDVAQYCWYGKQFMEVEDALYNGTGDN